MHDHTSDEELQKTFDRVGFISRSASMMAVLRRARKAAEVSDVTVLLEGETGTGKQVLARAIHELDQKRRSHAFVTVHCSTINETLAESELFGHQRGAFSGAFTNRKGLFQSAQHGTLFLDDVNDLPAPLQPKLLDVIQRTSVRPVGSDQEVRIDVRIIAACNQPLEPLVREKRFRADLFHRLNVVKLSLPPLRGRTADLSGLILGLAKRYTSLYSPIEEVEPQLVGLLAGHSFPGNVRELENAVQRMLFLKSDGVSLGVPDWTAQLGSASPGAEPDPFSEAANAMWQAISQQGISYARAFEEIERRVLETAIRTEGSTRRQVAQRLHTSERTLYYKMRAHGLRHPGGMHD